MLKQPKFPTSALIKALVKKTTPPQPKFQGKGTRARLNTAAEKKMFDSKYST